MSEIRALENLRKSLKDCTNKAGIEPNQFDTYWITANACDMLIDEVEAEIDERFMELPVDSDGVPIHVGDNLHSDETECDFPCRGYNLTLQGSKKWWTVECCYDSYSGTSEYVSAKSCHHVKPRTLEDVLADVVTLCANTWKDGESPFAFYDVSDVMESGNIREYADEIRELLKEGGE